MTKKTLKKIYRDYIFGAGTDNYKMKDGSGWEKMIPMFAFNLKEEEREQIHQEYFKAKNAKKSELKKAA
jgi:hypothetical protein